MRNTKAGLLFLLTLVFISCRSLSPVAGQVERYIFYPVIETVTPQWQPFAEDVVEGISYCAGKVSRPRMEFHALRIDLSVPELKIFTAGGSGPSVDGKFLSTKVSSFVRENGLLAGINAVPFDVVSDREGEQRVNVGLVISDGDIVSPPHERFDALIFYTDGTAAIMAQSAIVSAQGINGAVGGLHRILADNEFTPQVFNTTSRHPRSAAGISLDGRLLYLLVIDGRRSGSVGATEAETALLLRSLGAGEGINLDGGGSTSLALRYPDGIVRVVNTPIHNYFPGNERAVAGCLGIRLQ